MRPLSITLLLLAVSCGPKSPPPEAAAAPPPPSAEEVAAAVEAVSVDNVSWMVVEGEATVRASLRLEGDRPVTGIVVAAEWLTAQRTVLHHAEHKVDGVLGPGETAHLVTERGHASLLTDKVVPDGLVEGVEDSIDKTTADRAVAVTVEVVKARWAGPG